MSVAIYATDMLLTIQQSAGRRGIRWGKSLCAVLCCLAGCGGAAGTSSSFSGGSASSLGDSTAQSSSSTQTVTSISAMTAGDIYPFDLSSTATLSFAGADAAAQYVLLVQSTAQAAGSAQTTVSTADLAAAGTYKDLAPLPMAADDLHDTQDVQEGFEALLRAAESELPHQDAVNPALTRKSIHKSVAVGTQETFRVLSSLYSTSAYTAVTATVVCANSRVAVYIDDAADSNLSAAQIDTLCDQFDHALAAEYELLGDAPDINGDGVVTVLMTKVVNQLGGSSGGIVTGFFYAGDMLSRSSTVPSSNEQEIIFTMLPDPSGQYGTAIPVDFALSNLLPAVVPHEVQHLLSYYNHVQVNGGTTESAWLNEGMSHLIEDLVGYGQENPSRVELYLAQPYSAALIPSGSPGLTERGASYLFLRYLYEQVGDGDALARALVQTDQSGANNVLAALTSVDSSLADWETILAQWGIAVALTNAGVTSDAQYIYADRTQDVTTGEWHGVCLQCDTDDGRGTTLSGVTTLSPGTTATIRAGANAYYSITDAPSALTVVPTSASMQGVLIRLQ